MSFKSKTVRIPSLGLDFEVLEGDSIIGPAIERGSWAEDETFLFRRHVAKGSKVVDLGANVGWFAVQAILAGAEVHAFEPVPGIADLAERNMRRAMAVGGGRGTLHRCAAGAARGTARIAIGARNFGDNRVVERDGSRPRDMGDGELIEIEIVPVDELVQGPVRFFKIDTQGSEWHAFQGMRRVLDASPRCALLLEFWPYALRGCLPADLLGFLAGQGFTLGKATAAPYKMKPERILRQALDPRRDPVKGGMDLYGVRGLPFHVVSLKNRLRGLARRLRED
ncbi:MAG: FkbM family methyltransferase [Planctomycetes bacterium]|nr:FkbM family methyltransferase [Planctomycetota bacterium]